MFGLLSRKTASQPKARLALEPLEERTVLSVTFGGNDVMYIRGSGHVVITEQLPTPTNSNHRLIVEENGAVTADVNYDAIWYIDYGGTTGNDYFWNHTSKRCDTNGGYGNDTLIGGSGYDSINGSYGDDYLDGGGHDGQPDVVYGGTGADTFKAEVYYTGPSVYNRVNGDITPDFNAAEGDRVDWGDVFTMDVGVTRKLPTWGWTLADAQPAAKLTALR